MAKSPKVAPVYMSTKTYGHSVGLTCCFRQWRAESHCRFLHGYPIKVKFCFEATELDVRNWVVDFGSLKSLKGWLEDTFDHKTIVASDDPYLTTFRTMHNVGIIDMVELPATGMEKFAEFIYEYAETWLIDNGYSPRCRLAYVEVSEHDGNSAVYMR
jgi:6-pyruvoyltetrahydropterin/6-carboxytetrahydropterin synthase